MLLTVQGCALREAVSNLINLFDLVAKITLDTKEYEEKVRDSGQKAKSLGDKLKGGLSAAAKIGTAAIAAVGTATAALGTAMIKGIENVASYGDNIDKMSQKMGLSAQAYQEWDAIMRHSGTSIDSMQRGMTTLSNAAENGSEAFAALGISIEDANSMSQEELFSATITALQNMEAGTERTVLAQKLLGGSAKELGALLNTSAEETEAMRQRVHELGGVMSDEAVKAAAAYQDSLQDMKTAFSGLSRGLLSEFMPSITTVMDGLTAIFSGDSDSGISMISDGLDTLVGNMTEKLPEFIDVAFGIIDSLVTALIDNLPKLLEMGAELLAKLVAGIIGHIPQLVASIPQIIAAIIRGFVSAWPQLKQAGIDLLNMVGEGIKSLASSAVQWGKDMIQNFIDGITAKFQALKEKVSSVAATVKSFLGFSEPEEGPLSNFHTYAPDMMKLFAQGIKENEHLVTDQIGRSFDFGAQTVDAVGNYSGNDPRALTGKASEFSGNIVSALQSALSGMGVYIDGRKIGVLMTDYQLGNARAMGY